MAEPDGQTDEVVQGIKRALDAADAANEAAADIASLQAAYRSFADAVIRTQRRNTLFASGAAAGSMVAIAMAGVVYFRSVEDLRIASAVQSDAAALLVDELTSLDKIGDTVTEQQQRMREELLDLLEKVKDEIRRAALDNPPPAPEQVAEPMDAQVATAIREGVKMDLEAVRDQLLTAIAEMRVGGGAADTEQLTALIAELRASLGEGRRAEPKPAAEAPAEAPAPRPAKPKPAPAPEPDPFTYP